VVGNWFDAEKAADLSAAVVRDGAAVILAIAGGANEGIVQTAADTGAKVVWFDTSGYAVRPGVVVGSAIVRQDRAAYDKTMLYLQGGIPFGTAEVQGVKDGYVDFIEDDALYVQYVGAGIREKQAAIVEQIRAAKIVLE
jgi:simple sugar transport system substrate-binding protein